MQFDVPVDEKDNKYEYSTLALLAMDRLRGYAELFDEQ